MITKTQNTTQDETRVWFTISEAAEYLRVSEKTLRRAASNGTIKYKKPTKKYVFHIKWLNSWVLGYGKKLSPTQGREVSELQS
ncbi:MAG: helix-turn-helix domain-containing protein [Candidatus Brocadiales bacterium]|nr:helix-turn-helix domain-containing protein [Candidatus Brocadiales bacterium]